MRRIATVLVLVLVLLFIAVSILWTRRTIFPTNDSTTLQSRVNAVGAMLRAPADHNSMTVAISPIPQAQHIRYQIQEDILKGMTDQQIVNQMVQQYGPGVLAAPRLNGFGASVWLLPIAILVGSCLTLMGYLRVRRTKTSSGSCVASTEGDSGKVDSLSEYLKDFL